ncbi:hypothetical protein OH76DRAFT_1418979 [Lentinus brumalis]|uniref:Uncharacterized protein n=1 Tax=Lentinus brumalis TaxID=2498619 RepID=A0A371D7F8_9APHY|nr:hypothetical protein OH76DRAFT_1418979 [Polyporus brumalis]
MPSASPWTPSYLPANGNYADDLATYFHERKGLPLREHNPEPRAGEVGYLVDGSFWPIGRKFEPTKVFDDRFVHRSSFLLCVKDVLRLFQEAPRWHRRALSDVGLDVQRKDLVVLSGVSIGVETAERQTLFLHYYKIHQRQLPHALIRDVAVRAFDAVGTLPMEQVFEPVSELLRYILNRRKLAMGAIASLEDLYDVFANREIPTSAEETRRLLKQLNPPVRFIEGTTRVAALDSACFGNSETEAHNEDGLIWTIRRRTLRQVVLSAHLYCTAYITDPAVASNLPYTSVLIHSGTGLEKTFTYKQRTVAIMLAGAFRYRRVTRSSPATLGSRIGLARNLAPAGYLTLSKIQTLQPASPIEPPNNRELTERHRVTRNGWLGQQTGPTGGARERRRRSTSVRLKGLRVKSKPWLRPGAFERIFNPTLPKDHESHIDDRVSDNYEPFKISCILSPAQSGVRVGPSLSTASVETSELDDDATKMLSPVRSEREIEREQDQAPLWPVDIPADRFTMRPSKGLATYMKATIEE